MGRKTQLGHQLHHVARGEVFAGLLVVFLVEAPDQLFEECPHGVIVQGGQPHPAVGVEDGGGGKVDGVVQELLDHAAENVGVYECLDLVAELELFEYLLDVGREAVQVRLEVGPELLHLGAGLEAAERVGGRVEERLAGRLPQRGVLVRDTGRVEHVLHAEDGGLGGFQHGVQAADDHHGEDDVAVLAAHIDVPEDVIGDAPDEVRDPAELLRCDQSVSLWCGDFGRDGGTKLSSTVYHRRAAGQRAAPFFAPPGPEGPVY